MDFLKFFIPLYLLAGKKVSYYLLCSSLFEEFSERMSCISCCDEIIDKKDLLSFQRCFTVWVQRIFFSNSCSLFFGTTRLMAREEFFVKRGEYLSISWSEIIHQKFCVIRPTKYPVSETNGRVNNNIRNVWEFLFHTSKKLSEVDMVDMIVDKFESMNPLLHILIIICPYHYFFK